MASQREEILDAMARVEFRMQAKKNRHGADGSHTNLRELHKRMNWLRNKLAEAF